MAGSMEPTARWSVRGTGSRSCPYPCHTRFQCALAPLTAPPADQALVKMPSDRDDLVDWCAQRSCWSVSGIIRSLNRSVMETEIQQHPPAPTHPRSLEEMGLVDPATAGQRRSGGDLPKMKKFRFQLLSDWIADNFTPCRVADVGGGKGMLAYLLERQGFDRGCH